MKKITLLFTLQITSIGFGQNLLTNGDFENGATAWGGNAFNAVDDGSGTNKRNEANITTAGNPWDVSLNQPVTLVAGTTYVLSYTAYTDATTGTRTMTPAIPMRPVQPLEPMSRHTSRKGASEWYISQHPEI